MPSRKRTAKTAKPRATRTPKPKAPVAAPTEAEAVQAAPSAEAGPAEQQPAPTEPESPEAETPAEEEAPAETPDPEADEKPEEPEAPTVDGGEAQPAELEMVELGGVKGRLGFVPVERVLSLLDDEYRNRIERQRALPSVLELQERVRASEGRCAPIIVTGDEGSGEEASAIAFFHGADTLAAAINISLERVAVVMIAPGDAGAVQSFLVQQLHQAKPTPSEDDDLMWRVNATDF